MQPTRENARLNFPLGRLRMQVMQKQDQRSGILTEGTVHEILTNSATHPHGIKVRLESGPYPLRLLRLDSAYGMLWQSFGEGLSGHNCLPEKEAYVPERVYPS